MEIPVWAIIAAIAAMGAAIAVVFRTFWTAIQRKDRELQDCQALLLAEKEEKVRILAEFKLKLEKRKNGGTDVRGDQQESS